MTLWQINHNDLGKISMFAKKKERKDIQNICIQVLFYVLEL